jgi:hypothetical protein
MGKEGGMSVKNEPEPTCEDFIDVAREQFSTLITAFELQRTESGSIAYECWIEFRSETIGVRIIWERAGAVWVELSSWADGRKKDRSSLEILLLVRAPEVDRASETIATTKQMREVLSPKEQLLRQFAPDVLKGDCSIFQRLHAAEDENRRRRNVELFGTETGETT